jgi:hypothetical protein
VEPSWVEKRIEEEKTQWVDLVKNPVATRWLLFFFIKTTSFWFEKKIDPDDPVKTRDLSLGPGRAWKLCPQLS